MTLRSEALVFLLMCQWPSDNDQIARLTLAYALLRANLVDNEEATASDALAIGFAVGSSSSLEEFRKNIELV